MDNIGERIKALRKNRKLTQKEFGRLFGVTNAHISSVEKGKVNPSEMFILFIIEKLNVNEIWLRTGEGEMQPVSSFGTETMSEIQQSFRGGFVEAKKDIVKRLKDLLVKTPDSDIEDLVLSADQETVTVRYQNGCQQDVCVAADSCLGIIIDVISAL